MGEQVLYRRRGIRLTTESLEIRGGGVYPLQVLQGVTVREEHPSRRGPVICMLAGLFPPLFPLLPVGVIWLARQKSTYWLSLQTEYGTVEPLAMNKAHLLQELQVAIAAALESQVLSPESNRRDRLRQQLLELAQHKGGEISVTDGVLATGCGFGEVKALLDDMLASGYVQLDNHWETGVVIYRFPELLAASAPRSTPTAQPTPEQLRQQLLQAAQSYGGQLSVTQGVLVTGQSFATIQALLAEMVASGYGQAAQDGETGVQVYCFPELTTIAAPVARTPVENWPVGTSPAAKPPTLNMAPPPAPPLPDRGAADLADRSAPLPLGANSADPANVLPSPSPETSPPPPFLASDPAVPPTARPAAPPATTDKAPAPSLDRSVQNFKRLTRELLRELRAALDSIVGSP